MSVSPEILALIEAYGNACAADARADEVICGDGPYTPAQWQASRDARQEREAARERLLNAIALPPRVDSAGGAQVFVPQAHGKLS